MMHSARFNWLEKHGFFCCNSSGNLFVIDVWDSHTRDGFELKKKPTEFRFCHCMRSAFSTGCAVKAVQAFTSAGEWSVEIEAGWEGTVQFLMSDDSALIAFKSPPLKLWVLARDFSKFAIHDSGQVGIGGSKKEADEKSADELNAAVEAVGGF